MNDLVQTLTSQLGVDVGQAEGGLGLIAKLAKDKLSGGDFSELAGKVNGLESMIGKAPAAEAGGGAGGMLGGVMSALGGSEMAGLAQLASGFEKLGMDAGTVTKFAPIVMNYVQENGGDVAKNLLSKIL